MTEIFLSVSGLFDFDLTFATEALIFLVLSFVVTSFFLVPISKQIEERNAFLNFLLKKSIILINLGYEKFSKSLSLLSNEMDEMKRQISLVKDYTNKKFDSEILLIQKGNDKFLTSLKGELTIKSAFLFFSLLKDKDLFSLTNNFLEKRTKSS